MFLFDSAHLHDRCGCCSIVCLRFHVMQRKQADCKMSIKKFFSEKTFRDILTAHTKMYSHHKVDSEASAQT